MKLVGIDYSLTSPAICLSESLAVNVKYCEFHFLTDNKKTLSVDERFHGSLHSPWNCNEQRYLNITNWVLEIVGQFAPDRIYIEDYSYASTGRVFNIAENAGLLKHYLYLYKFPFVTVPPTVIKKFATGKGNSNKEQMNTSFVEQCGLDIKKMLQLSPSQWNPSSDLIDSYYICKYGAKCEQEAREGAVRAQQVPEVTGLASGPTKSKKRKTKQA